MTNQGVESNQVKNRHLNQLPQKSFKVAPGDVVGGLIYVMDKPLGIEEGMVGISIDSPAYRAYIKDFIRSLDQRRQDSNNAAPSEIKQIQNKYNGLVKFPSFADLSLEQQEMVMDLFLHHPNIQSYLNGLPDNEKKIMTDFASEAFNFDPNEPLHKRIPVPFITNLKKLFSKKMHEMTRTQYINEGMGGLLFEQYKVHCGIRKHEPFAKQIQKLITQGNEKNKDPNLPKNKVYMIKQDGELGLFGGTGPSVKKILKTTTGRKLQNLMTPKWLIPTLGLSGLYVAAVLGVRKIGYLLKNKPTTVNAEAITETIATKIASVRGCYTQDIETVKGTYEEGSPKIVTMVTWTPGCRDLTGKLMGGDAKMRNIIVAQSKKGEIIKIDKNDNLLIKREIKEGVYKYIKIDTKGNSTEYSEGNLKLIKKEYDTAKAVSEDKIDGLGESLITYISLGDRDGIGKKGQNKAVTPAPGKRFQFFGIDFGKAFKGENPIVGSLRDDFSFKEPVGSFPRSLFDDTRFVNYSIMYDNPLREKMKGVYLLAALRGLLTDPHKEKIAKEYEATDKAFAEKLRNHPVDGLNSDLMLIDKEITHYLNEAAAFPEKADEFKIYIERLNDIRAIAVKTDNTILKVFEKRLKLLPSQIDILEKMEKLTAHKAHILSSDGKVILNHIQVKNKNRIPWQFDDHGNLVSGPITRDLGAVIQKFTTLTENLSRHAKTLNPKDADLESLLAHLKSVKFTEAGIKIPKLTDKQQAAFSKYITEESIAIIQDLPEYRNDTKRKAFHDRLKALNSSKNTVSVLPATVVSPNPTVNPVQPAQELFSAATPAPDKRKSILFEEHHLTPLTEEVAISQNGSLEQLNKYLNDESKRVLHNIKYFEASAPKSSEPTMITFEIPLKSGNEIKIQVRQQSTSSVQFSSKKDLSIERFRQVAIETCRLAVFSAAAKAELTISDSLADYKKVIMREAFDLALKEAITLGLFNDDTKPQISPELSIQHKDRPSLA